MKKKYIIAVMLAALLLIPVLTASADTSTDGQPAFRIDERAVLQGMKQSWQQGYEPSVSNNMLSFILPIRSERAEGAIQTELILADEEASPFKQQTMTARTWRSESGIWEVTMTLRLMQGRRNGDYPCTIRITGTDSSGSSLRTDIPYTFHIRDGLPNTEQIRLSISQVQADLRLGEQGKITVVLTNPCRTATYEQITLRIMDASGDIIPQYAETLSLAYLAPGESQEIVFPVTVLNKASVTPHVLQFRLEWSALDAQHSQTEGFTLAVRQEIRLENGGIRMASSVVAGDSITLALPLMNMGRADVINVLATLTLPGVTDRQSVLVGTIGPGETRQAQITLSPGKSVSGDFEGSLTVEATDNDGNPTSFSLPVHLTVEAPAQPASETDAAVSETEKPPILLYGLAGGCGLLLLLLLLQGFLLRRKIHRLEEERL